MNSFPLTATKVSVSHISRKRSKNGLKAWHFRIYRSAFSVYRLPVFEADIYFFLSKSIFCPIFSWTKKQNKKKSSTNLTVQVHKNQKRKIFDNNWTSCQLWGLRVIGRWCEKPHKSNVFLPWDITIVHLTRYNTLKVSRIEDYYSVLYTERLSKGARFSTRLSIILGFTQVGLMYGFYCYILIFYIERK